MDDFVSNIFLNLLNLSISASWLILAVILLRFVFKKAPKWVNCLLWGIAGIRLVFPFSVESIFSLVPSAETVPPDIVYDVQPKINSGIPAFNSVINPVITENFAPHPATSVNPLQVVAIIASYLWIFGLIVMVLYALISFLKLKHKMRTATLFRDNIFQSENVQSPFVLGLFRPKIYLSYNMKPREMFLVVSHEKAHIKRKDHWIKPFAYLVLCVYWFNPAVWLAYILLCRDIEMACDEKVVKEMDGESRKDYSEALLSCSVNRRSIAACPLAFGEVGVKDRIKGVMNYKKPAFWVIIIAAVSCVVTAVCFLTNPPQEQKTQLFGADYDGGTVVYAYMDASYLSGIEGYEISEDGELWAIDDEKGSSYNGTLEKTDFTRSDLLQMVEKPLELFFEIGKITEAYELNNGAGEDETETDYSRILYFVTDDGRAYSATVFRDEDKLPEETVMVLLELTRTVTFEEKMQNLETAVGEAVLENNFGKYVMTDDKEKFASAKEFEAHNILHSVKDAEKGTLTVYALTLYKEYISENGVISPLGSGAEPVEIIFKAKEENGNYEYILKKYRPLGKGDDIENYLPEGYEYDDGEIMVRLQEETYEKAMNHFGLEYENVDGDYAVYEMQNLDTAVGEAIIENNKNSYYIANAIESKQELDIALSLESHEIIYTVKDEEEKTLTAYVQTLYEEYIKSDGIVTKVAAGASPARIVFDIAQDGVYDLRSYFAPKNGEAYPEDMEKYFRQNPDYDDAAVMTQLKRECYERATEQLGFFGDYQNAWIAHRFICMSSASSYLPDEYARHYRFNFDGEILSVTDGSGDLQKGEEIVYESKYSGIAAYTVEKMETLLINNTGTAWVRTDTKDMLKKEFTVYTFADEKGETVYTLLCENKTDVRFFVTGDLEKRFRLYEAVDKNIYMNS